jgi:hypothetical protein
MTFAIRSNWRACLAAVCVAVSCSGSTPVDAPPAGEQAVPDFSAFHASYHVPFAKPVDFDHLSSLHVRVSLNGGPPVTLLVDTGSVGIIVAADQVPGIDPHAPAGSMVYSSSGVELDGVWTPVTVTFLDSKDANGKTATAAVPVLAASERKVIPGAVNGGKIQPSKNPKVFMMGVGFGRGKEPHPERNPLINLTEMQAGTMRRGYAITRDGITLGLAGAMPGFEFQKLTERVVSKETAAMKPGLKDWETARGSVTVDGKTGIDSAVLMDTGLTNMMIGLPEITAHADLPAGTPVTVNLLGGKFHYSFKVGDTDDPVTPRKVTWVKPSFGPSVNTGLRAFSAFDYLYDADGGYLGLRATIKHP